MCTRMKTEASTADREDILQNETEGKTLSEVVQAVKQSTDDFLKWESQVS